MSDAKCIRCRAVLPAGRTQVEPGTAGPSCEGCQPAFEAANRGAQQAQLRRELRGVLTPGTALPELGSRPVWVLGLDLWETWSHLRVIERDPIGVLRDGTADPRDAWPRWDAIDDLGTRYWGFTEGSSGPDTRRITFVGLYPAIRDVARRLRLIATYDGTTSEAIVDLTALRRRQPSPKVHTEPPAPVDQPTCRQCAASAPT